MTKYINQRDALLEVDDLLKSNKDFLSSIEKIGNTAKRVGVASTKSHGTKKGMYTGLKTSEIAKIGSLIKEYGKNVNISKFFEERVTLAHDFDIAQREYVQDRTLYNDRSFADLVKTGPKNQHEEVILMAATAFLEPQEMKNAVHSGASIKDVCTQIDNSLLKRMSIQIMNKIGVEEVEKYYEPTPEPGLDILSKKFGILDAIMEAINDIGKDAQKYEASQKEAKRGQGK